MVVNSGIGFTSSMSDLCLVTLVLTIPLAWLLHRFLGWGDGFLAALGSRCHDRDD